MEKRGFSLFRMLKKGGFPFFLLSFVFVLILAPFGEESRLFQFLLQILLYCSILYSLYAARCSKKLFRFFIFLAVLGGIAGVISSTKESLIHPLGLFQFFNLLLFSVVSSTLILRYVLDDKPVTSDKIFAAICFYFFLGMIWSFAYGIIEMIYPGSFSFAIHFQEIQGQTHFSRAHLSQLFYYSIVTLTTLGYGDIAPISHLARTVSMLEAFTGQLYLAVLVARLVALQVTYSRKENRP